MPAVGMPRPGLTSAGAKVAAVRRRAGGSSRPECSQAASAWNAMRSGKPLSMPRERIFKILASCRHHTARLTPHEQAKVESIRRERARPKSAGEKDEDLAYHAVSSGLEKDARRKAEWDRLAGTPGRHEIRTAGQQTGGDAKARAAQHAGRRDLRHKAAEAGRDLVQYLNNRGRIKDSADISGVKVALDRFRNVVGRLSGDRSKAVADAGRLIANVSKQIHGKSVLPTARRLPVLTHSIDSPARNVRKSARPLPSSPSEVPAIAGRVGPILSAREQAQEHRRRSGTAMERATSVVAKASRAYQRSRANAKRAIKVGNEPLARKHVGRAVVRQRRLERALSIRNSPYSGGS